MAVDRAPERSRQTVIYILCLLLIAAVVSRMLPHYLGTPFGTAVTALLAAYVVLFATERPATRRLGRGYLHGYLAAQAALTLTLVFAFPLVSAPLDYFASLFLPLCMQAAWHLADRAARGWVAVLATAAAASMLGYYLYCEGSWDGVSFALVYVAGCLLVAGFSAVTRRAEEARRGTQALLAELQEAHRRLEEHASQVEELAAVHERNRLARELHDSVSQTLFSMTLTAEAARLLLDRDPSRVAAQPDRLQTLARDALAEMRSLILQRPSRPPALLAAALFIAVAGFGVAQVIPVAESYRLFGTVTFLPTFFPAYILLFGAGILGYRNDWLTQMPGRLLRVWAPISLAVVLAMPPMLLLGGAADGRLREFMSGLNGRCARGRGGSSVRRAFASVTQPQSSVNSAVTAC